MADKIYAMLVDDEQEAIDYLSILLEENCPQVELVATATNSTDALIKIYRFHPELVFMDIKIDDKDGFDIVEEMKSQNHVPHVIFVTAYDHYAIDAFRANATDYLLKPVEIVELCRAVEKYAEIREKYIDFQQFRKLVGTASSKIRFNTRTGYILVNPEDIVYCQSDGNYTELFLNDDTRKLVTYNLRNMALKLPESFKRISRFHVINEKYLSEVDKSKHQCFLKYGTAVISLNYSSRIFDN